MGSFSIQCALSGLGISAGDKVKFFLLNQNGSGALNVRNCYSDDAFSLRTLPIGAQYNDYGSVENFAKEDSFQLDLWKDMFSCDIISVGTGKNEYHDPPVSKKMSIEQLLDPLWEGRVRCKRHRSFFYSKKFYSLLKPKSKDNVQNLNNKLQDFSFSSFEDDKKDDIEANLKKFVPTVENVTRVLCEAFGENKTNELYSICTMHKNIVKVTTKISATYDLKTDHLSNAVEALSKAFEVTKTFGADDDNALILCVPKLDIFYGKPIYVSPHDPPPQSTIDRIKLNNKSQNILAWRDSTAFKAYKKPYYVQYGMIRQDVWDELLKLKPVHDWDYKNTSLDDIKSMVKDAFDCAIKSLSDLKNQDYPLIYTPHQSFIDAKYVDNKPTPGMFVYSALIDSSSGHRNMSMLDEFYFAVYRKIKNKITDEQINALIKNIAETIFILRLLNNTRHFWRPSMTCGPQYPEYKIENDVYKVFASVAKQQLKKHKQNY